MSINFETSGAQIDGARDYQEDAFLINQLRDNDGLPGALLVIADGMGGHAAGNVASNMAVQTVNTHLNAHYPSPQVNDALRQSVLNANHAIRETIAETTALEGMGCTMVAAVTDAMACGGSASGTATCICCASASSPSSMQITVTVPSWIA